ncbi:Phytosulfokine [Artemisia annua]|uniref:Phytosulfokine n=1 Tax=Artemisia annua TaxID=35608 RepID=A0A2U1LTN3_ARTAN|nr:Phytosulfokine [Artemisia annua]
MSLNVVSCNWNETINSIADKPCNNSIWSIVRRLCLAAAVYGVWNERNYRIFRDERCNCETVLGRICEQVRWRLISLKAKPTSAISQVEEIWNIKIGRIGC